MQRVVIKDQTRVRAHAITDFAAKVVVEQHEPTVTRVEVLRQGGVVTGIEVRCKCGETTVIELDYPAAP